MSRLASTKLSPVVATFLSALLLDQIAEALAIDPDDPNMRKRVSPKELGFGTGAPSPF
jgi:hypothetical protein